MASPARSSARFRAGHVVALLAAIVLALLVAPWMQRLYRQAHMIRLVGDCKQLATLATIMDHDGSSTGNPNLGYPGDLAAATGKARIVSLGDYVDRLIAGDYLKRGDVGSLFSGPGIPRWNGVGQITAANSAFKVFKITRSDPGQAIFLETRNYAYNRPLSRDALPLGDAGFVVGQKDTSATNYTAQQYNLWRQIGTLTGQAPGSEDHEAPGTETASMMLP
jgi:hypothetical protein